MHMGNKKYITLLLLFVFSTTINAQNIRINEGDECFYYNQALLARSLIDMKEEKSIHEILDSNVNIRLYCKIDTLGYVQKIKWIKYRIYSSSIENRNLISQKRLESYLRKNKIKFFICCGYIDGYGKEESIEIYKKSFRESGKYSWLLINFPIGLFMNYDMEREKLAKQNITLSKYDYLIKQIKYYLKE